MTSKVKHRRSVSMSAKAFCTLRRLADEMDVPMAAYVETLVMEAGEAAGAVADPEEIEAFKQANRQRRAHDDVFERLRAMKTAAFGGDRG